MEWFDTSMEKHNEPGMLVPKCDVEVKLGELQGSLKRR